MMQIPLKRKYRHSVKGTYKGGERAADRKRRTKVGYQKHVDRFGVPRKRTLVVDGKTGAGVMADA